MNKLFASREWIVVVRRRGYHGEMVAQSNDLLDCLNKLRTDHAKPVARWTPILDAYVAEHYLRHKTAQQIADVLVKDFGFAATKNAVIGRYHRKLKTRRA